MADEENDYVMRDYYEVLKVAEDCTEQDIRKAYKRGALRCHPDKNPHRLAEAEADFKEVQQAYNVLIDDKERAWYDAHKDAILRGDSGDNTTAPDEVNLFDYMNPRCFNGLGDEGKGFFAVFRMVFDAVCSEEAKDWKQQMATEKVNGGTGKTKLREAPKFGGCEDDYETVVAPFYSFWSDYSTRKSFAWKDEYKAHEIDERFARRKAEQINAKVRAQAKKEYNEIVQNLVAFVKRRDPRVAREEERKAEEEADKADEQLVKDIAKGKRQKAANMKLWEEMAAEEAIKDAEEEERFNRMLEAGEIDEQGLPIGMDELLEKQRQSEEAQRLEEAAEKEALGSEVHTCDACGGTVFKGATSWTAHQNSKKHKANLRNYQREAKNKKVESPATAGGGAPPKASADTKPASPAKKKEKSTSDGLVSIVEASLIVIFSRTNCPYCKKAKTLLHDVLGKADANKEEVLHTIEVDKLPEIFGSALLEEIYQLHKWKTVPAIFLDKKFIGGLSELQEAVKYGDLGKLLGIKKDGDESSSGEEDAPQRKMVRENLENEHNEHAAGKLGRAGGKKGAFQRDAYAKKAPMPAAQVDQAQAPVTQDGKKLSKKQKMKQQQANARHALKGNSLDKEDKFSSSEDEEGSSGEEEEVKPSGGGGFSALGGKGKKKKK